MCIRASIKPPRSLKLKVQVAVFNQEKALAGTFSVIIHYNLKLREGSLAALMCTRLSGGGPAPVPQTPRTGFSRLIGGEN